MGYMGFGMQSWIYKTRPRKPFSVERKPSFDALPKYSRKFKLKPSIGENKKRNGILIFFITLGFMVLLSFYFEKFNTYNKNHEVLVSEHELYENEEAFNFLINSGKSRLSSNNNIGAYSEFKLAYNIRPENEEITQLLIKTLGILCFQNEKYCNELDDLIHENSN